MQNMQTPELTNDDYDDLCAILFSDDITNAQLPQPNPCEDNEWTSVMYALLRGNDSFHPPEPLSKDFIFNIRKDLKDVIPKQDYVASVLHYTLHKAADVLEANNVPFGMHPLRLMPDDVYLLSLYLFLQANRKRMCDLTQERFFRAIVVGVSTLYNDVETGMSTILRLCLGHVTYTFLWLLGQKWCETFRTQLCAHFEGALLVVAEKRMSEVWNESKE